MEVLDRNLWSKQVLDILVGVGGEEGINENILSNQVLNFRSFLHCGAEGVGLEALPCSYASSNLVLYGREEESGNRVHKGLKSRGTIRRGLVQVKAEEARDRAYESGSSPKVFHAR